MATINEALRMQALRVEAARIVEAFDSVPMDFSGAGESFGYGGCRDLSRLVEDVPSERVA